MDAIKATTECSSSSEFRKKFPKEYDYSVKTGLIYDLFSDYGRQPEKTTQGNYTLDYAFMASKDYSDPKIFKKNEPELYKILYEYGFLGIAFPQFFVQRS